MTLDEKIAVLGTASGVPRLEIPNAGRSEGIHGLVQRPLGGGAGPGPAQKPIPTTRPTYSKNSARTPRPIS